MTKAFKALGLCALAFISAMSAAEMTWVYSVQLSAAAKSSPPRIELSWVVDELAADSYTVYRKGLGDAAWGDGVALPGSATGYADDNVEAGRRYEYQVIKRASNVNVTASGYIAAGVEAALLEDRGRVVVVVDQSVAGDLGNELALLEQDLAGDGWSVVRKEVARDAAPRDVRDLIRAEYDADRARTRAVLLLGHVPVVRSGSLNVDGHAARPMPADVFYGEMDGKWTDANNDGVYEDSLLPSDVELQVGRVDFADLPGTYAASPYPSEVELLKRYLAKDHAYRHALVRVAPRALVGNAVGNGGGQAYAASGYRNFSVLVGPASITTVPTGFDSPADERWLARLLQDDYTWAYGCGGGSDFTVSNLGTHGPYNDFWASDFLDLRPRAAFYLMFGSWFADWSQPDNLLRSALASRDLGLAAAWSGRPHLFFHPMGTGETIGYGIRLSQNNRGTVYQNQVQRQLRGVHIALLGDPTLRLHIIAPPSDARTDINGADVLISWKRSPDDVAGYHVYRAGGDGRFVRLTDAPVPDARFLDVGRARDGGSYMVRAIALQNGSSGSYVNASQGVFAMQPGTGTAVQASPAPPPGTAGETGWVDDALPAGATALSTPNDRWNWVAANPTPLAGALAHQSDLADGFHFHFFVGAATPLAIKAGDVLFAHVFLDPDHPPREILLTWCTDNWEHRAYWGENLILEGTDGDAGRRYLGPLPDAGRWVRLEVPASAVGLEGQNVSGMGFNLFDGRATWDQAGKRTP